ncbi:MAG: hypothetical protein KAV00_17110 [Phycisphaerae bacterium]|nr:hypothetical protein [Phycisphaerae bacterium]
MKDDKLYLIHISECIAHIEQYVSEGRIASGMGVSPMFLCSKPRARRSCHVYI